MQLTVSKAVRQVVDGLKYEGTIALGQATFEYQLEFPLPIPELDAMEHEADTPTVRRLYKLTLKKGESVLELTDEEFEFFFALAAVHAVELYNLPQTRSSNEGKMGALLEGKGPLAALGASVSIGMTSVMSFRPPDKYRDILNAPKFDCRLAA